MWNWYAKSPEGLKEIEEDLALVNVMGFETLEAGCRSLTYIP